MKYEVISLDYDGVVNDLISSYLIWLKEYHNINTNLKDWDCYSYPRKMWGDKICEFWEREEYYSECKLFEGALEFIKELSRRYIVQIVTSTPSQIHSFKDKLIRKQFGNLISDVYHVRSALDKYHFTKGTILVEDYFLSIIPHAMRNHDPSILLNYFERYPWIKIDQLIEVMNDKKAYCINYTDVLEEIENFNKG